MVPTVSPSSKASTVLFFYRIIPTKMLSDSLGLMILLVYIKVDVEVGVYATVRYASASRMATTIKLFPIIVKKETTERRSTKYYYKLPPQSDQCSTIFGSITIR